MVPPDEVDVTEVFEIRILRTDDGHEHGVFIESWADDDEAIDQLCDNTEYDPCKVKATGRTV
jgi:hypothetical protein